MQNIIISFIFISLLLASNCATATATGKSTIGSTKSHNNGKNCLDCHKTGGDAEAISEGGVFSVAGSVYNTDKTSANINGYIYLYTQANGQGELKYTIEVDALGNFYTTDSLSLSGLYPAHKNKAGNIMYMSTTITEGACNACHNGSGTPRIYNQ